METSAVDMHGLVGSRPRIPRWTALLAIVLVMATFLHVTVLQTSDAGATTVASASIPAKSMSECITAAAGIGAALAGQGAWAAVCALAGSWGCDSWLGGANASYICWADDQWWGGFYRLAVWVMTGGRYTRC